MQKIMDDADIGRIRFVKKTGIKRINIRVHPHNGVVVSLPFYVSYETALKFFAQKRQWILSVLQRMQNIHSVENRPEDIALLRQKAAEYLPERLCFLAKRYGFTYKTLRLKHNKTNWGSCSSLQNINLNISLMGLPPLLRDYVIIHELCHLRHHDHSAAFHLLVEHICTDHIIKLMESGDPYASDVAHRAAVAKYDLPLEHILSFELKKYRP